MELVHHAQIIPPLGLAPHFKGLFNRGDSTGIIRLLDAGHCQKVQGQGDLGVALG